MFYGVDISYAQGNYQPNTETFIIINASRANVGLVQGSMYKTQVNTARSHGKEVGHYFFNGNRDPVQCANFFVDNLYDHRSGDVLVLDVESEPGTGTIAWSPAQVLAFAKVVFQRTGKKIGVYLNKSLMNGADWSQVVAFGCWLWIAYYNATPPPIQYWPDWTIWQWTSQGIDKNQAKAPLAQISVAGGGAVPIPDVKEEDMPYLIVVTADGGDAMGSPIQGSQAIITNERGWVQTSSGMGPRDETKAWNAIADTLGFTITNVSVSKNGWEMAKRWVIPSAPAGTAPTAAQNAAAVETLLKDDFAAIAAAVKAVPAGSADLSGVTAAITALGTKLGSLTLKVQ